MPISVEPPVWHLVGFCAISNVLPLPRNQQGVQAEISFAAPSDGGMNVSFGSDVTAHCVAAEPHSTFLRLAVTDGGRTVAYETVVLGRLRCGYRVFQLRSLLGTRIELCYLFVQISAGSEPNVWATARQLRLLNAEMNTAPRPPALRASRCTSIIRDEPLKFKRSRCTSFLEDEALVT